MGYTFGARHPSITHQLSRGYFPLKTTTTWHIGCPRVCWLWLGYLFKNMMIPHRHLPSSRRWHHCIQNKTATNNCTIINGGRVHGHFWLWQNTPLRLECPLGPWSSPPTCRISFIWRQWCMYQQFSKRLMHKNGHNLVIKDGCLHKMTINLSPIYF